MQEDSRHRALGSPFDAAKLPLGHAAAVASILAVTLLTSCSGVAPAIAMAPSDGPDPNAHRTYLLIVAHPDDENIIGAYLARLAREGHSVRVIVATDGNYGTRVTDIPEGDELGALRRRESECAARALGIAPPTFLSIDRLDTKNGVRAYLNGRKRLLELLKEKLREIAPDVVITFGPDGEYGHPEHIVVGAAITELLLRDALVEKYPLYYIAWTQSQVVDDDELSYVDERYLDVKATYSDADEKKSFVAARCYASQFTPQEIDEFVSRASADASNVVQFRRFFTRHTWSAKPDSRPDL